MDKEEGKKFNIKELFTNRQYRSIIILVFYVLLFTVLIASLKINQGQKVSSEHDILDGYELIYNNNFAYEYDITLDNQTFYYNGKKNKEEESFSVHDQDNERWYYIDEENCYIIDGDSKIKSEKPFFVFDFFDTKIIEEILSRSSKGEEEITISNQALYDLLSDMDRKIEEGNNSITLMYRNSNITEIHMDLSNYVNATSRKYDKVIINLRYYDFDLIDNVLESQ